MPDTRATLDTLGSKSAAAPRPPDPTAYDSVSQEDAHGKLDKDGEGARDNDAPKEQESPRGRRSQVAHSLMCQQSAEEFKTATPAVSAQVQTAIRASVAINLMIVIANSYAVLISGSLAVLSSLVDSILDLTSQALFWYADKHMHTPHTNYPAGRRRLEPVAVVISATLMGMTAIEVVDVSIQTLVEGFDGTLPDLDMAPLAVGILVIGIAIKLVLWWYCSRIAALSPSADALAQGHRNDVFSNSVAAATSVISHYRRDLWYLDSFGAIALSVYIGLSWLATGNEQVERLIGHSADPEFIEHVRNLVDLHHPLMKSDVVRAYHFGNQFLVEMEVVLPETMTVRVAHDIVLELQKKVEELDSVERAFVRIDYQARDYDRHKDLTVRRNSTDPRSPRKSLLPASPTERL